MARLGALGELDFDHLDLRQARFLLEQLGRKRADRIATTKVRRPDLPHDVATEIEVVRT